MHWYTNMPCSHLSGYKRKTVEWPHSVCLSSFLSMKVSLCLYLTLSLLTLTESGKTTYYIPYNYYEVWSVIGQNSSGQLFSDLTPNAQPAFIWKSYNASDIPRLYFDEHPGIVQDDSSTTPSGDRSRTLHVGYLSKEYQSRPVCKLAPS